jgi:leucyl-tRNA---protein transferase
MTQAWHAPQFYLTPRGRCPYLENREERKIFTHMAGKAPQDMDTLLTQGGFRRSQGIAYRPACEGCAACTSVRVIVDAFDDTGWSRILKRNRDILGRHVANSATSEQYSLFRDYICARHSDGGMTDMSMQDYAMMVEDSAVKTSLTEYRRRGPDSFITGEGQGPLLACALIDQLSDGLSMVYAFYDPEEARRSLGTFMILDHIARARLLGLRYLYLGYFVKNSPKMAYKARFLPQERLTHQGWQHVTG